LSTTLSPHAHVSFFFNDTAPTEIYTLSLHDALPIFRDFSLIDQDQSDNAVAQYLFDPNTGQTAQATAANQAAMAGATLMSNGSRSEEHTSELQSLTNLVCRLLLEKKKKNKQRSMTYT